MPTSDLRHLKAWPLALATVVLSSLPATASPVPPPTLGNGEPILRMPFPAGTVVLCQQGNRSPKGFSHSWPNCLHALDLANPSGEAKDVLAAADGTVASVVTTAEAGDPNAGNGFGNYVKLDHGHGYFTFYAHLAAVRVRPGDRIPSGTPLGTMGNTGKAGNPHLHFSLHRGLPRLSDVGVGDTVPMHALIAADLNRDGEFTVLTSLEFVDSGSVPSLKGHLYGSENVQGEPIRYGLPKQALAATMATAARRLREAIERMPR